MPKGKKKARTGFGKGRGDFNGTSDEESVDNCSIISLASDGTLAEEGWEEVDEVSQNDVFEEKLIEAVDGMTQKSAQGRCSCIESVCAALSLKYLPEFVIHRKLTLTECIERCLKKGRGAEQVGAAQLASLLCVQLGSGELTDEVATSLTPVLTFLLNDNSIPLPARAKCAWALGVLSFLSNTDEVDSAMSTLEGVFSGSYQKGDGSLPNLPPEVASLHQAALSSWSLLLTIVEPHIPPNLPMKELCELLDSSHLEVRMAAGEAIALLLERLREGSSTSISDFQINDELLDKLHQLATDSHKYRAKKDRKAQRSSFRDILKFVEDDEPPCLQIKFGQEALTIDSWAKKKQYDTFCQLLGSGLNLHLTENELLRDILELGEKISPLNLSANKQTKIARHQMNAANFKARCISRGKNRDKRCATILS